MDETLVAEMDVTTAAHSADSLAARSVASTDETTADTMDASTAARWAALTDAT